MYCFNGGCKANEIEKDDNFCYVCGHWTAKGYMFLKDEKNVKIVTDGKVVKQSNRLHFLWIFFSLLVIIFFVMLATRKDNLFKPFFYLKREVLSLKYGYKVTLLNNDLQYNGVTVNDEKEAKELIKKDFESQNMYCFNDFYVEKIALDIEKEHNIQSVSFCDVSIDEAKKLKKVIDKIYVLFPNIEGALTNITITNARVKSEYIARFQPVKQFVNIDDDIKMYNKVNKTQILLNSYYFLNEENSFSNENKYVKDSTLESLVIHEFGHYISFLILLKEKNIDNVTLVTKENYKSIEQLINDFNSGNYSFSIVNSALEKYNIKYGSTSLDTFAKGISSYAALKSEDGTIIYDEVIAEAVHDYFLHENNMTNQSKEIVNILKEKLSR